MNLFEKKWKVVVIFKLLDTESKVACTPYSFTSSRFRLKYVPYVNACTYDK